MAPARSGSAGDGDAPVPVPWHLKVLAGGVALYLGYRAWQGVVWLWDRL